MAVYLSKKMLNVAKSANLTVDLTKLGKVQTDRLYKFLTMGNVSGEGVPAQIAVGIFKEHQSPYVYIAPWRIRWHNLPTEAIQEIQAVGSALKMMARGVEISRYDLLEWLDDMVAGNHTGEFHTYILNRIFGYDTDADKPYIDCIKAIKLTPSDTIKQIAEGIKSRSITEVSIQIFTGE